jgi:hypothetical protein
MGNHTKPWDIDEGHMEPSSYTLAENWGGQINFMIPLDREGLKRCRSVAKQQHDKMKLNYELVRIDNCAKLQQKGFMLLPGSRVYHLCSDVIPITAWKKAIEKPKPPKKPWWNILNFNKNMSNQRDAIKAAIREETKAKEAAAKETKTTTKK